MAPKHTTSGPQEHYPIISSVAPAHTTDGPHRSEYSATGEVHEQKSLRAVVEDMAIDIVDPDNLDEFEIIDEPPED